MTVTPLNPWLETTLRKAKRFTEDSDRKLGADRMFFELIRRTHRIACVNALDTEGPPTLERFENEGNVWLILEWHDRSSLWSVKTLVKRESRSRKLFTGVEMYGNPQNIYFANPDDEQIRQALWEYFYSWRETAFRKPNWRLI